MANNLWNDQISKMPDGKNVSYKGKLQPGGVSVDNYLGKQSKNSGGDIGLSGKHGGKNIGIKPDSQGLSKGTTMGKREYS